MNRGRNTYAPSATSKLDLSGDAVFRCVMAQLVSSATSVLMTSFLYIFLQGGFFKSYAYGFALPHLWNLAAFVSYLAVRKQNTSLVFTSSLLSFLSAVSAITHFVLSALDVDLILRQSDANIRHAPATYDVASYHAERDFLIFCGAMLLTSSFVQLLASGTLVYLCSRALECRCCAENTPQPPSIPPKGELEKY